MKEAIFFLFVLNVILVAYNYWTSRLLFDVTEHYEDLVDVVNNHAENIKTLSEGCTQILQATEKEANRIITETNAFIDYALDEFEIVDLLIDNVINEVDNIEELQKKLDAFDERGTELSNRVDGEKEDN